MFSILKNFGFFFLCTCAIVTVSDLPDFHPDRSAISPATVFSLIQFLIFIRLFEFYVDEVNEQDVECVHFFKNENCSKMNDDVLWRSPVAAKFGELTVPNFQFTGT